MRFRDSMHSLADLHERAHRGALSDAETSEYREELAELARALLAAQLASLEPGQKERQALRVARPIRVELAWRGQQLRTSTLNLSTGGFAALVTEPPELGQDVNAVLTLPGERSLRARARPVNIRPQDGYARVGFQFVALTASQADELAALVLDSVVARLAPEPEPEPAI